MGTCPPRHEADEEGVVGQLQRRATRCATCCIHVPISETVWPIQNSRKFRWRASVRNGLRGRDGRVALTLQSTVVLASPSGI